MARNNGRLPNMLYTCHIAVQWGRNDESMESVARRLAGFLKSLATIHPAFSRWWYPPHLGQVKREFIWAKPFRAGELLRTLESRIGYTFVWRGPPEPGYSVLAGNDVNDTYRRCMFSCPLLILAGREGPRANSISLQSSGPHGEESDVMFGAETIEAIFRAMIAAWEPVWGDLAYRILWDRLRLRESLPYKAGWMTYLGPPFVGRVTPPSSVITEQMPQGGTLLITTKEPMSPVNPAHIAAARALQQCFAPINADDPLQ